MKTQGVDKKCLYIRFEDLTGRPEQEMQKVYNYLGLPEFQHDFNNVEQLTQEDDAVYGMTADLHTVRPKVESVKSDYIDILGEGLCKWIDDQCAGYQQDYGYLR